MMSNIVNVLKKIKFDDKKVIFFLGIITIPLLFIPFNPQLDYLDDNCHYMNLGKALYTGQGYVQLHIPDHPTENLVAPGLPAIFALIMAIRDNPKDIILFKTFTTFCIWLFLVITAYIFIRYLKINKWVVFVSVLFFVLNPRLVKFGSLASTEAPFLASSALAILALFKYEKTKNIKHFWIAVLLGALTAYIKVTSIPFIVTIFVWFLTKKQFYRGFLFAFAVMLLLMLWLLPTWIAHGWDYSPQFIQSGQNEVSVIAHYFSSFKHHIAKYSFISLPDLLLPFTWGQVFTSKPNMYGIIYGSILIVFLILGLYNSRKDVYRRFFGVFVVFYIGLYLFLSSCHERYLAMTIAGLVFLLYAGIEQILKWFKLKGKISAIIIIGIFVILTAMNIKPLIFHAKFSQATQRRFFSPDDEEHIARLRNSKYHLENNVARFADALVWCRDNLPSDAIILTSQTRTAYFTTDMICVSPGYWDPDVEKRKVRKRNWTEIFWNNALEYKVDYTIVDAVYITTAYFIRPATLKYQHCMELLFESSSPKSFVFKIDTSCVRNSVNENHFFKIETKLLEISRLIENENYTELSKAIRDYKTSSDDMENIIMVIDFFLKEDNIEIAESLMTAADTLYSKNHKLWLNYGISLNNTYIECYDFETENEIEYKINLTLEVLDKALSYGADTSDVYNNIGVALSNVEGFDMAIYYFIEAYKRDPSNPRKFNNVISTLSFLGRIADAKKYVDMALERTDFGIEFIDNAKKMKRTLEITGEF